MRFSRRLFVAGALAAPFVTGRAAFATEDNQGTVRNNISAFRTHEWQDHFDALGVGVIISDTTAKVLQHWTSDGQMYLYPSSVPLSDELTRRGYTEVVEKRVNPSWAPTPSMRERNPEWPAFVPGGDPTNPLGTRALISRGSITGFMVPMTRARSADARQTAVLDYTTNTSKKCSTALRSERR